jgi:hypothetical protein
MENWRLPAIGITRPAKTGADPEPFHPVVPRRGLGDPISKRPVKHGIFDC